MEPGDLTPDPNSRNPPLPPAHLDPPPNLGHVDPPPKPEVPMNSDWEPGKIPTIDEDPKRLFTYRNPLYNNPFALHSKVSNPIPPITRGGSRAGEGRPMEGAQEGPREVPPPPPGDTPMDHPKEDLPAEMEKETSSQKVAKASKNVAHPSKTPRKALKYTDNKCTILDPHGHPIANLKLMDVVKSEKSTSSRASKCKEPDTPDLGSGGASAPSRKQVQSKGATLQHRSTPKISMGVSLHDAEGKNEDNYDEDDGEEDDENPPEDREGKELGEDDPDFEHDVQVENDHPLQVLVS